jgi:hypothetical protein
MSWSTYPDSPEVARLKTERDALAAALLGLVKAVAPDGNITKCEPFFHEPLKAAAAALAKAGV